MGSDHRKHVFAAVQGINNEIWISKRELPIFVNTAQPDFKNQKK